MVNTKKAVSKRKNRLGTAFIYIFPLMRSFVMPKNSRNMLLGRQALGSVGCNAFCIHQALLFGDVPAAECVEVVRNDADGVIRAVHEFHAVADDLDGVGGFGLLYDPGANDALRLQVHRHIFRFGVGLVVSLSIPGTFPQSPKPAATARASAS